MRLEQVNSSEYDIAVIGGGPAGASSAYNAARLGLKTILFEKKPYPREKLCGGALSERCVPLLGEHAIKAANCRMDELQVYSPSFKRFVCDELPGRFIIRKEFDAAMARDAGAAGVEIKEQCAVKTIKSIPGGGYEIDAGENTITSRYVILAMGIQGNSLIKQLGMREKWEKDYLAMCMMSETPIDNRVLEPTDFSGKVLGIFFGAVPNGYGWYFVKEGYVNIGIGASAYLFKKKGRVELYNQFIDDLRERGFLPREVVLERAWPYPLPFKRTAKQTVRGNALLVGDSAGFVSPVTGEGLYYAIKGGQLAAEAIYKNLKTGTALSSYQENWLKDFGNDMNKYGYFLRQRLYKSRWRMGLAVEAGHHDKKFAAIQKSMIVGSNTYRQTLVKAALRFPVSLVKLLFKSGTTSSS